ncbi:hypothetical protein TBR22_A28480 [Luteitalea sp. TBR-22]|uniref:sigma-54 interaction domain-containing protein n=1 Tax=Luteitalea sp. TBR-22 TaxID=2802971 RepID=UPI001AFBB89A|nr:sigma 54-interacting transcriptional regulator [Luteitalea sp. TBR-22]BCS33621.1 hypothetical protein TBR22_A28480 [Luteitalea sp. TBR-22]
MDVTSIRGGRLLSGPGGLRDLATGWSVRIDTVPGIVSAPTGTSSILDQWACQDWLGRWRTHRVIASSGVAADLTMAVPDLADPAPDSIGVTHAGDAAGWCGVAAAARRAGWVPVHVALLRWLDARSARAWPPLCVAVTAGQEEVPVALASWVAQGGRVAAMATTGFTPVVGDAEALPIVAATAPAASAHGRLVRRAWRARGRGPAAPSFLWCRPSREGPIRMTHLELLDVTAALEEVRRDEDALVVTCRAVRRHTGARRAGILAVRGTEVRVLATDEPSPEAVHAWRRLCLEDGLDGLASTSGWHASGRHQARDDLYVHVCGTWPTRDEAVARSELLPVFARLASSRVPTSGPSSAANSPLADTLVGESVVMRDVRAQIALAARAPFPVLIRGESGCGKELAARAIHALGPRRQRRCAAINCAALPDDLIESELFGHVRGAFTGAAADRTGLFDEADGGTLFLDEVGELGARAQAKLLRVLQDGEVRRVGENTAHRVDVRVIAATNVSLEEAVRRGTFRADLFYRLDVVRVRMPALRERREDIPALARHFWRDCAARVGSRARLEGPVLDALAQHDWPGNVRQLQNTLAALAVRVPSRGRVGVDDLPPELRRTDASTPYVTRAGLDAARRAFEATYVRDALSRAGGRPSLAARDLGLTRQGLSKLVRRLRLDEPDEGPRLP